MKLLLTGAFAWMKEELEALEQMRQEILFMAHENEELPCDASWVEGVVCNSLFISHPIEQFTNLKYIQLTSAGFDRVPMDYVNSHGIQIFNARGVYSIPMAEFALSGVLDLYKRSRSFYEKQKVRLWEKHREIQELHGKTVCIVGCGSVGTECAIRFKAFNCKVIGVDVMPYQSDRYEQMVALDCFDELLPACDVIVLTLPLTDRTRQLLSKKRLGNLKNGAVLVNIARGEVVDQLALAEELKNKRISAVLDVFDAEPLVIDSPLWEMDHVVITPHNSFVGEGNHQRMLDVIIKNIKGMNA
jgi:phosphoglycerate dehydrogenase-like enzyme